ncbi:hypothetical protein [Marinilabilia sp.]|uniref:hypothetical protein n=1 Tax=Marinilabilia sp. TaxID=2021252 RepID=UPI0025C59872|nr:hypothetical protein [Marinilabilia sp.]
MKRITFLFLICILSACNQKQNDQDSLKLETTNVNQLVSAIDQLPVNELVNKVEVDSFGNTIDTVSKELIKYYDNDKVAYFHKTSYTNGDELILEQYLIPNGEFILMKTSSPKFNYAQTIISDIDSTGLILGLTMFFVDNESTDTIDVNYDYDFNRLNEREKLIISTEKDTINVNHHIYFKNNQPVREYNIVNSDTTSISSSVYVKDVLKESVSEDFSNGNLRRRIESYYNKSGKIVSGSIYFFPNGEQVKNQESTYKYDSENRLKSITEKTLPYIETRFFKMEYIKK